LQITMKMQLDFEGRFIIKAMNPTNLTEYTRLKLKTDYVV